MNRAATAFAFVGWSAILAMAYHLADARIALCDARDTADSRAICRLATTATRDNVLVWGAIVALAAAVVLMARLEGSLGAWLRSIRWTMDPVQKARVVAPKRISGE